MTSSNIIRFNIVGGLINPDPQGLYVRYEDHAAALAAAGPGPCLHQIAESDQPAVDALDAVKHAVRDFHFAMDTRQHGGVAAGLAMDVIQAVLGMDWQQGAEATARAAQSAKGT
jgi:hypothetical protein